MLADASSLPFKTESFDVITATAVIEHIEALEEFFTECHRVLRKGGIFIVTTSQPFYVRIYTWFDKYERETSHELVSLTRMIRLSQQAGFEKLKAKRYMMSPIGFPWERSIEKILRKVGLRFFLISQLVVGRKNSPHILYDK